MKYVLTTLAPALLLFAGLVARAAPGFADDLAAESDRRIFAREAWVLTATVGSYDSVDADRDIGVAEARIGIGYYFLDDLAVVGELHASRFTGSRQIEETGESLDASTAGVGAAVLVRWHFLRGERWTSHLDLGWGLLATEDDFPPGGSSLNGTSQYGLGWTWRANERFHLVGGARQLHVSNGRGLVEENPSYDSLGGYLGAALRLGGGGRWNPERTRAVAAHGSPAQRGLLTQIELQVGAVDDHEYAGARLDLDAAIGGRWRAFLEATGAELSAETFRQVGAGLYRRAGHGLVGLVADRQQLDVFTTDRIEVQAERHLGELATVAGLAGWEVRSHAPDRWRGALRLRIYPTANLLLEPGLALAETPNRLASTSVETTLNVEYQPPVFARLGLSLFVQDRADELLLAGIRIAPGRWPTLKARHRQGVFHRVRF